MKATRLVYLVGLLTVSGSAGAISGPLYEEELARTEEEQIFQQPIAGIENDDWFDYRIDVTEAQKELKSDLGRASDVEDLRDAWQEYASELRHERKEYIRSMAKRGYRHGTVTVY